jgi:hypothetical protein
VANKERPPSPPKQEKTAASTSSKDKGKGGAKGKDKGKDKDQKGSRPSSQQFDHTKPHWNLRIASDASGAVSIHTLQTMEGCLSKIHLHVFYNLFWYRIFYPYV